MDQKISLNSHFYSFIKIVFYQSILLWKSFYEAPGEQKYILDAVPALSGLTM